MTRATGVGRGNNPASHVNRPRASRQHRWKAGSSVASNGYVKVRVGKDHPLADPNGYAYEHVVVWCAAGHPRPPRGFILHHRNEDRTDNRLGNLELLTRAAHNRLHIATRRRDPATGRLLDGVQHDGVPA
jgi:hypothetical protein